jgi:DNA-binding CsgD family transcriptional regulator
MIRPEDVSEDFRKFTRQLEFDLNLSSYKDQLIDWQKLDNTIVLPNQFFYINDFVTASNIYIHPNAELITGYSPKEFEDFGRIYELTHPNDMEFVYEFSKRSITFCKHYKQELLANPFQSLFTIDFRLKHRNGHYIKLNRQTTCLKTDREGNMVFALVYFNDVTSTKKGDGYNISWIGDTKYLFHFDDLLKKYSRNTHITCREKAILNLLTEGYSATKIAEKLNLSVHTVISHRKNLLEKTSTKNTAELVRFAIEKSLI